MWPFEGEGKRDLWGCDKLWKERKNSGKSIVDERICGPHDSDFLFRREIFMRFCF